MTNRKLVVTGGSGRVGRYVLRALMNDFEVSNADLEPGSVDVPHLRTDVMDLEAVRRAVLGADAVIHLAAIDFDWKAAPEAYIRVNTIGSWQVLQAAAEAGVKKVVLCSSVSACGLSEMRPDWRPNYLQVDEAHENRPVQAYSVSKLVIEQMGRSFAHGTSMDVICLRPLAVVMKESFAGFVDFIDAPDRNWLFYYVTAEDVATSFRAAVELEGLRYGVFFISADDTCREEPTVEWYGARFGVVPPISNPRLFQLEPRAGIFSNYKAKEVLGWKPTSDFLSLRRQWLEATGSRSEARV